MQKVEIGKVENEERLWALEEIKTELAVTKDVLEKSEQSQRELQAKIHELISLNSDHEVTIQVTKERLQYTKEEMTSNMQIMAVLIKEKEEMLAKMKALENEREADRQNLIGAHKEFLWEVIQEFIHLVKEDSLGDLELSEQKKAEMFKGQAESSVKELLLQVKKLMDSKDHEIQQLNKELQTISAHNEEQRAVLMERIEKIKSKKKALTDEEKKLKAKVSTCLYCVLPCRFISLMNMESQLKELTHQGELKSKEVAKKNEEIVQVSLQQILSCICIFPP